ncbi:xanthine dehydrogenase family protein molybdopterin-binding subunit [Azospirillum picis]|uniref:Xanthine dehydrogenase YagR molybdenum-binding subunit n=1 Tax=Azospirillum picis TaxID=488438 RepID=A0ABU0MS55_9PROT|nr:xanthine dehydrogenase family protein molybdopterin-binding subunit [Azospirillum picis]MBP2302661.1 xanthine dehydrogenase YagR molybdenum-binding subunit [Azospirillum picis]MDQ0536322.1 xanthine dehydrogenase YagR molybdenum-binding subunit [Azospirillum picis]
MTDATVKMDAPFPASLLDSAPAPTVGTAQPRIDGPRKVSGTARYAAEHFPEGLAHGVLLRAPIGCGRITGVDAEAALAMPGVLALIRDERLIRNGGDFAGAAAPVQGVDEVAYFGQPIGVVVADSPERARAAALSVKVTYEAAPGVFDMEAARGTALPPTDDIYGLFLIHTEQGDVDRTAHEAAALVDAVWRTPSQSHAAMEPHASVAVWQDGRLTLHASYQSPVVTRDQLATVMGLQPSEVRILSPFVGGGFGGKLGVMPEAVAAAIAARHLGRPVKVVMTRQQVFETTGRRPMTHQRVRLAADAAGRLTVLQHETITDQLAGEVFFEPAGLATHLLYAGENRLVDHKVVRTNKLLGVSMRAPGEAIGQLALECAMDELAEALDLDPIELRLRNEPERHPELGIPFSSRALVDCLRHGADRFGWASRNRVPGGLRDGEWLVGHGMAAAARGNLFGPSRARVRIDAGGRVMVETEMTDIGTGTYTVLAQIAADLLGVPLARVEVRLGDTDDPASAGSGGSWGAATSGSAVYAACAELRARLAAAAGLPADTLTFADGMVTASGFRRPIAELVGDGLSVEGSVQPGESNSRFNQTSYGAHFCEVRVHAVTGELRVARWNSVFAAGRILNRQTATSQAIGGVVFGIGGALTEELVHDPRSGKVVNRDLGEYHVPVHADIPPIDVHFLEERDPVANPLLAKGVGELGVCGSGAAVANAVYNATGVRVRDFPITLDKVLAGLPPVSAARRRA